ncbi:MAG: hypothetical protein LBI61_04110 [Puniceicoccales bacterium]|jgi:hypothetical protein|nr:hypothetical protein [Puniceicoccales bacterium]
MAFANEKFLAIALVGPIFVALMLINGAQKTAKKLEAVADEFTQSNLLKNFCPIGQRIRFALDTIIPVAYAFILAGWHGDVGTDMGKYLIPLLAVLFGTRSILLTGKCGNGKSAKGEAKVRSHQF